MTNSRTIKMAKKEVDKGGMKIIYMYLDHQCRKGFWKRFVLGFTILTKQHLIDDMTVQRRFRKIKGRISRQRDQEAKQIEDEKKELMHQVNQAIGMAAEAKIIISHLGQTLEGDGYSMEILIKEALDLAEEAAKEAEERETVNGKQN